MLSRDYRGSLALLLSPYVAGTVLLVAVPFLATVLLAFTHYDGMTLPLFAGMAGLRDLLADPMIPIAIRNSALFILVAIPLRTLGALALALLLNRPGAGFYRVAVFLPTVIPEVAYALIWLWILNPLYGPLNVLLGMAGLPRPEWLVDPKMALLALVLMSCFQIGEGFVVMLAGLRDIPQEYYDAASVDGAGTWGRFRLVTLPLLAPWLLVLTVRDIILSAQYTFTPALVMTQGGPYYATLFLPYLIYEVAFDELRFGAASAMMVLMYLGIGALLLLLFAVSRGWGYEGEYA